MPGKLLVNGSILLMIAIAFITGQQFPRWQNTLPGTALKFDKIRRLVVDGDKVTEPEVLLRGYECVRDLKIGPDGALYMLTNTPDALLRNTSLKTHPE